MFIFFSASMGKRPVYLLPLYPAVSLLTAVWFYGHAAAGGVRLWLFRAIALFAAVTGILLLPALAILYWEAFGGDWRSKAAWTNALWRKELASLFIVPVGLASYMIFLHGITGNALAFSGIHVAWGRGFGFFLVPLIQYFRSPLLIAIPWDFRALNAAGACLALAGGLMLLKWKQWALGVYTVLSIVAALSTLILQSEARIAMALFPAFIALAVLGERPRVDELIRTVSIGLLCLMTALFIAHFSIALA